MIEGESKVAHESNIPQTKKDSITELYTELKTKLSAQSLLELGTLIAMGGIPRSRGLKLNQ